MSASSLVKIRIKREGEKQARIKKAADTRMESRMPIPMICSMVRVSCLPQYWAGSMAVPEEIPAYTRFKINMI